METQILSLAADQVPEQTAQQNTGTAGLLQSGEAIQGYTIQNLLSTSGGEAEIYLCIKDGQTYVFKYFYNRQPDSEILQKLFSFSGSHPGIVSYIDSGTYKDRYFLILEYAKGGALDDKNPDGTYKYLPLSEDAVLQIVKETVDAFEICHANGIIHRDIKPGNLFYKNADSGNSGSGILIGDFGIASAFEADMGQSKHLTKAGNAQTIGYAAPETSGGHKEGKIVIGKEVDYYALGITVWALLTGKEPFVDEKGYPLYEGQIILDTIYGKTADKLIARSPQLSGGMQKLIRGFLTVRHDKRWGGNEVKRFLAGEDVEIFAEAVRDLPPFEVAGEKYYQFIDVARALLEHREEGKNLVFKGKLGNWLIRIPEEGQELEKKFDALVEDWSAKKRLDEGLVFIAYSLCPSLPFTVGDGKTLISLGEILSLLETNPEALVPFLRDEKKGFYIYLEAVGMSGIGDQVRKVVQAVNDDFKLIPRIIVALQGNVIKPFQDKTTAGLNAAGGRENEPDNSKRELKEIDDLYNLPAYLKERVLLFIERRCGELPAWIENLTGKDLELWLYKIDRQRDALNAWGKWKYFTLFLRGNDIQCGEVFEEKGKKGFKDPLGNVLLPPLWEDVKAGISGSFIVKQNGKWGLVRSDGSAILPFNYFSIEVFSEEWHLYRVSVRTAQETEWQLLTEGVDVLYSKKSAPFRIAGIGDQRCIWEKRDWHVVINSIVFENGRLLVKEKNTSWSDFEEYPLSPAAVFEENGKYGIAAADGGMLVPAEYDYAVIHGNGARFFVSKGGKWGLLNPKDNAVLIPCEYDGLLCNKTNGLGFILQKGKNFDVYFGGPAARENALCQIVKKDTQYAVLDTKKNELAIVKYICGFSESFDAKGWRSGEVAFKNNQNSFCLLKCYDGQKFLSVNIKTGVVSERSPDPDDGKHLREMYDKDSMWRLLNGLKKQNKRKEMNLLVNAVWNSFFEKNAWETSRRVLWFIKPDNMEGLDKKYDFYRAVIGDTLFNQQFFEEALEFYEEAIQLNPADDNYYLKGSRTSSNLGSHGKALEYIDKALKLNYERADLLACKGSVLSNLKENKEAIVLFSQAIEGESDSKALAGYYRLRGTAYQTLGLQNEANADFANEQKFK